MAEYDWMPEARQITAQCWCDAETSHLTMDPVLAEAVARRIAGWMQIGAQHAGNEEFWRNQCRQSTPSAESALTSDDRSLALSLLTECYGPVTENSVDFSTLKIAEKLVAKCRQHFHPATIPEARVMELALDNRSLNRSTDKLHTFTESQLMRFARLIAREATGGKHG